MGKFRDQIREARRSLHEYMSVNALAWTGTYDPLRTVVTEVTVRVHEKWMALGDLKGTNFNYAEIESVTPRMIFLVSEVEPKRGMYVSVSPGLAFRVDNTQPPDDITQTANVVRLKVSETTGFPVPIIPVPSPT
jgi:hypothetical protein